MSFDLLTAAMQHMGEQMASTAAATDKLAGSLGNVKELMALLRELSSQDITGNFSNLLTMLDNGKITTTQFIEQMNALKNGLMGLNGLMGGTLGPIDAAMNIALATALRLKDAMDGVNAAGGMSPGAGGTSSGGRETGTGGDAGASSTGFASGAQLSGSRDLVQQQQRSRNLVASAIDLGPGGFTVADRARILRQIQEMTRNLRR